MPNQLPKGKRIGETGGFMDSARTLPFVNLLATTYFLYYLWWRATQSLNPDALAFSWLLLLAEAFGVLNFILFSWMTKDISPAREYIRPKVGISVDVFVPTYNEDYHVLEATLVGCTKIRYPHETYVLDDGDRSEIKELAEDLGCNYIAREENTHAKAGNINNALRLSKGEFIVALDADMVPQPNLIDRTLGYFEDEDLAFVQFPQEFYNQDSIQHDKKRRNWHEQSLFFRVIQPGKNYSGSAFWTGSPSIIRKSALLDVGGVATETVTEDIHTSVRLHSRGWKSLFVNEVLANGIAPQTIHAFLVQRLRWAQGTMQLYRSKDNPLIIPNLSLAQRFSYLSSFLAYFEAIQKLILLTTPTLILIAEVFPMRVDGFAFFLRWIPYFILTILINKLYGRGYFNYFQTEKFNLLKMVVFIQSLLILIRPTSLTFKVTPKSVGDTVYARERRTMRIFMAMFGIITGLVLGGFLKTSAGLQTNLDESHFVLAITWAAFNSTMILLGIRDVLSKKHERKQYRFPVKAPVQLFNVDSYRIVDSEITDLSMLGAGITVESSKISVGDRFLFSVHQRNGNNLVIPSNKWSIHKKMTSGYLQLGIQFAELSDRVRRQLIELLYVEGPSQLEIEIPSVDKGWAFLEPDPPVGYAVDLPKKVKARPVVVPVEDQFTQKVSLRKLVEIRKKV